MQLIQILSGNMSKHVIQFPAQFHNYRGTTLGDTLIGLRVDKIYAEKTKDLVGKMGHEYMVVLIDVTGVEVDDNTPDPLKGRFMKKLHVMIAEYAELIEQDPEVTKGVVRQLMIDQKLIEKSTSEADYKGLAQACNIVQQLIGKENGSFT